ncbi:protein D2 [Parasteatoda tepidariorum]|uniref:protein D2 n=1 Tax=Parasteatoda tepidariorum TaxID=114398 RepID=UPI00077FC95A|nr:protein D2 [Parasteatoda tepidariorum]
MVVLEIYLIFVLLPYTVFSESCSVEFIRSGLVSKFIPTAPQEILKIKYEDISVECGTKVQQHLTSNPPKVDFSANENELYTLLMIDPDAPTPFNHSLAFVRHWVVVNIPGNTINYGFVNTDYMQPHPEKGGDHTHYHRYTFLIYKQSKTEPQEKYSGSRLGFNLMDYVTSHKLQTLLAGNFMQVREEM